jgi:Leucine rich repeat variant
MHSQEITQKNNQCAAAKDRLAALSAFSQPKRLSLLELLDQTSVACLTRIAENTSMTPSFLEQLASHSDPEVREAVADNPSTPVDTLWLLAGDKCLDVRYALAENHNLPFEILQALCFDDNPYVAARAQTTILRVSHESMIVSVDFQDRGGGCAVLRMG